MSPISSQPNPDNERRRGRGQLQAEVVEQGTAGVPARIVDCDGGDATPVLENVSV